MSFLVSPTNYLGSDHADHVSKCYSLALSDPKKFYLARQIVTQNLKRTVVKEFYTMIYNALSTATQKDGTTSIYLGTSGSPVISSTEYPVQFPTQKINEIALGFVSTLNSMLDEITDIIMPDTINKTMEQKLAKIGKADLP